MSVPKLLLGVDVCFGDTLGPQGYRRLLDDKGSGLNVNGAGAVVTSLWCKFSKTGIPDRAGAFEALFALSARVWMCGMGKCARGGCLRPAAGDGVVPWPITRGEMSLPPTIPLCAVVAACGCVWRMCMNAAGICGLSLGALLLAGSASLRECDQRCSARSRFLRRAMLVVAWGRGR